MQPKQQESYIFMISFSFFAFLRTLNMIGYHLVSLDHRDWVNSVASCAHASPWPEPLVEKARCKGHRKPQKHAVAPAMFSDVVGDGWLWRGGKQGWRLWVAERRYPSATLMSPCASQMCSSWNFASQQNPNHQWCASVSPPFSGKRWLLLHPGSVAEITSFCFSNGCELPYVGRLWIDP